MGKFGSINAGFQYRNSNVPSYRVTRLNATAQDTIIDVTPLPPKDKDLTTFEKY